MSVRLFADGNTGTVAIYTQAEIDDGPVNSPLSHVSRIRFQSDLEYPRVIDVRDGSFTMPSVGLNASYQQTHLLFAHGLGYTPFVEGYINRSGVKISLSGSVPIVTQSTNPNTTSAGFCRWIHLGATSTHVVIQEYTLSSDSAGFSASTLNYRVYVTDTAV